MLNCSAAPRDRHGRLENPKSSAIRAKSPLAALQYHEKFTKHSYATDMRLHYPTAADTGRPTLMGMLRLCKAIENCRCKYAHEDSTSEEDHSFGCTLTAPPSLSKTFPGTRIAYQRTPPIRSTRITQQPILRHQQLKLQHARRRVRRGKKTRTTGGHLNAGGSWPQTSERASVGH